MGLQEVLEQRSDEQHPSRERLEQLVEELIRDIKAWVADFSLPVQQWQVLVQYLDERLNLPSVTIHFRDDQVTVLPRSFLAGRRPQVEVSCGARVAVLEYVEGEGCWMYTWEGSHGPPERLTKEAFLDVVVAGLLR